MTDKKAEGKTEQKSGKKIEMPKFNIWMGVSAALAIILVISVINGGITGSSVANAPKDEVSERVVNLLKIQDPQLNPRVIDVLDEEGWYEINLEIEGEIVPFHTTKDGEYLLQIIGSFAEIEEYLMYLSFMEEQGDEMYPDPSYNVELDYFAEDMGDFISCLEERGIKIYGANWCGYTSSLVNNLGGYEMVAPIYVECTENTELCSAEGVTGYPTVKINGQVISPERTLQGFVQVTGCAAPDVGIQQSTNPEEDC